MSTPPTVRGCERSYVENGSGLPPDFWLLVHHEGIVTTDELFIALVLCAPKHHVAGVVAQVPTDLRADFVRFLRALTDESQVLTSDSGWVRYPAAIVAAVQAWCAS